MPQLGETVAEGKILAWFKPVGDEVKEGDNLFEVETDKVTMEVQSIVAGRLGEIRVARQGDGREGRRRSSPIRSAAPPDAAALGAPAAASARQAAAAPTRSPFEEVSTPLERFGPAKGAGRHPRDAAGAPADRAERPRHRGARRAARREQAPAQDRREGCARRARRATSQRKPAPQRRGAPVAERRASCTLNAIRQRTGERLAENWRTIPHVFQAIEVDFTARRSRSVRQRKEAFKASTGLSLTYLPFIARADLPRASRLSRRSTPASTATRSMLSRDINLGIAVDLVHNGLVVPVVRDAGDLTLAGLAKAIGRQIDKARAGKLTADDLSGGTYSITQQWRVRTTFTAPIINAPQVAILSTDAIRMRPVVVSTPQGAIHRAATDRHGRAELRPPRLRRRLFGGFPVAAEADPRRAQLGRRNSPMN